MRRRFDPEDFEMHNDSIRIMLEGLLGTGETTLYGRQYMYE